MVQILNKKHEVTLKTQELQKRYPTIASLLMKYYPIGISNFNLIYAKSQEIRLLRSLITKEVLDNYRYQNDWREGFCIKLSNNLKLPVYSSTAGETPNRSGYIIINEGDNNGKRVILHFYVSLISNYFYIEIVKIKKLNSIQKLAGINDVLRSWEVVVSPVGPYQQEFNSVYDFILKKFKNAKFLPFYFNYIKIKDLSVLHSNCIDCSIHDAFFSKNIKYVDGMELSGDIYYDIKILNN